MFVGKVVLLVSLAVLVQSNMVFSLVCDVQGGCTQSFVLSSEIVDGHDACIQYCKDDAQCQWFTYHSSSNLCSAFTECNNIDQSCTDCVSGQRDCPINNSPQCHVDGCCQGLNIDVAIKDSADHCLEFCNTYQECQWFSYKKESHLCSVFSDCPTLQHENQGICESGEDECQDSSPQCNVDGCCQGTSIQVTVTDDVAHCLDLCSNDQNCQWFSYKQENHLCSLLMDCQSLQNENQGVCISGEDECGNDGPQCNIDGCCQGQSIDVAIKDSVGQCLEYCNTYQQCQWFSYKQEGHLCFVLKDCPSMQNENQGICQSGENECEDSAPQCNVDGCCQGTSIQFIITDSAGKCLDACKDDSECRWFSYQTENRVCSLLKDCNSWQHENEGVCVSGESQCDAQPSLSGYLLVAVGINGHLRGALDDVELLDLNSGTACTNKPLKFPRLTFGSIGVLVNDMPMICAGEGLSPGCYKLINGVWSRAESMQIQRNFAAASVGPKGLWVTGGLGSFGVYDSTELYLDGVWTNGPSLAEGLYGHCQVQINSTTSMILGGYSLVGGESHRTWFYDWTGQGNLKAGPLMNFARTDHFCAYIPATKLVIVAGGDNSGSSTEVLDLNRANSTWVIGPQLPEGSLSGAVLVPDDNNGAVLVGGRKGDDTQTEKLWRIQSGQWQQVSSPKLATPRNGHVAMFVSENTLPCY